MDASLTGHDARIFEVWLFSPTVHSTDRTELILAFKISRLLDLPGSRVLKALRGVAGVAPEVVSKVEAYVESDPELGYVDVDGQRRIVLLRPANDAD